MKTQELDKLIENAIRKVLKEDRDSDKFKKLYWIQVGKELNKITDLTFSLNSYKYNDYYAKRTVIYDIIDVDNKKSSLTIYHNWGHDGTIEKPVTDLSTSRIFILSNEEQVPPLELSLGRFAIWTIPKQYAEDIMSEIKDNI